MKKRRFLIPSLLAAGFPADQTHADLTTVSKPGVSLDPPLYDVFRLQHEYQLAGHRSHSSHGSHGSHRSSSGGTAPSAPSSPSRNYQSTPPSSVLPGSPSTTPQKTLPGNSNKFIKVVREVQVALYVYGYYTGNVDGIVGPETSAALSKYQKDNGLKVTGTITNETLDALKIKVE